MYIGFDLWSKGCEDDICVSEQAPLPLQIKGGIWKSASPSIYLPTSVPVYAA